VQAWFSKKQFSVRFFQTVLKPVFLWLKEKMLSRLLCTLMVGIFPALLFLYLLTPLRGR
jgi:hypothetical protein